MDRRKVKGGSLHKNLIGSQSTLSSTSSCQSRLCTEPLSRKNSTLLAGKIFSSQNEEKSNDDIFSENSDASQKNSQKEKLNEKASSRKRKLANIDSKSIDDDDLGHPLAESTVLKKRRDNSGIIQIQCESNNQKTSSNVLSTRKNVDTTLINKCKFVKFLHESGIKINPDAPHTLCKDIIIVQRKMKELLNSSKYEKAELIALMEKYFENEENLKNALTDMEVLDTNEVANVLHTSCLVKILLQVSELHPEIYSSLLTIINEAVLIADSIESIPWVLLLLQQFRFLDVVIDSDAVISSLEQLLESCPLWFQTELITFLPDIVTDKQHQTVAEILNKLLEENSELIKSVLNCMTDLNLGKEYLEECKDKMLNLLKTNVKINAIPAIVKFVLEDYSNIGIFERTLKVLRVTDMQPLVGEDPEECYQNQLDLINNLKMNMLFSKNIVNTALAVIKDITKDPKPLDVILLLLIFQTSNTKRKPVETIFKKHIRSGFYRASLLSLLYNNYKHVVQELQPTALQISSNLLKTDERVFNDFAIDWFRLQFKCHKTNMFKQREILERIIFLMGDNDQTIKNTLLFLCKMVEKKDDREYLLSHCNHLRILLEKMDNLNLEEVGTLNDILQHLCTNSSTAADSLRDDLSILMRKQLSNFKPLTKSKGVLAAVMAIKHLMQKTEASNIAYDLFKIVLNNVKNCPRSQALFYDQLSSIILETKNADTDFIKSLADYIEEQFINTNMIERTDYRGELVPKFGLNDEPQNSLITFENKKYGAIVPISFKLLRTCCIRLSENRDLEAINTLLGCAILMPESLDVAENPVVDSVLCCINWFRELICGFVTQNDPLLRKQVLQRLDNLIDLQTELSTLLTFCDTKYQPPPCYFHKFPLPPFFGIDKKVVKKGIKGKKKSDKKSLSFSEIKDWESGFLICSKNPIYFRKFDASIVHLLDVKMDMHVSQSARHGISVKQVCFIVQELLGILEHDTNEKCIKDLIELLPKICAKLRDIVETLREGTVNQNREAARLLLRLLTKIFNWKGFESVTYNILLREGLRILASQIDKNNITLRSCRELVTESCKYFESLTDIATQISLSTSLIDMCQSLMKHSESYTKENKEKYAKMAFGFLCLQWPEDNYSSSQYKSNVVQLLNHWINNEPLPLQVITSILEWLPDEISNLERPQSCLSTIPSITKANFHFLFKKIFDGLISGIKIALETVDRDPKRIKLWYEVGTDVQKLVGICKTLTTKNNLLIFLKHMPILLKSFLNLGMPILEHNLKYQTEEVTKILKMMQGGTRYLHAICCDNAEKKDITLMKYIPAAKSVLEKLIYCVKGMLVLNNTPAAFWMGNLVNKNLEGQEIFSQNVSSEDSSSIRNIDDITDDATNISSDILGSDSDDDDDDEDVL